MLSLFCNLFFYFNHMPEPNTEEKPVEEKAVQPQQPAPQPDEAHKQCSAFWEEFKVKCEKLNVKPVPVVRLKLEVADGMNQRERNLCTWVSDTYLQAQIVFQPIIPGLKVENPPKEEKKEEEKKEEVEKPEDKPKEEPKKK